MDASSVSVHLPTERPLYHRPATAVLESALAEAGAEDFSSNALTEQVFVNRDELTRRVFRALGPRDQVGLRDVVAETPLEHGLAELITYLSLVEPGLSVVFDRNQRDQLEWVGDAGERVAEMPRVTFTRGSGEEK